MRLRWDGVRLRMGRRDVLSAVDLGAEPGEFLAIVGPNGAGKSTLLRSGAGLIAPNDGRILLDERPLHEWSPRERARRLAYVPQRPHLDYPFTVREAVAMGRYAHVGELGALTARDAGAIDGALKALELGGLATRPVTRLSGGERQRVALARGLAQEATLLLLDEPTSGLDLGHAHRALAHLRDLARSGRGVVAVLHDLEAAARSADRLALVGEGRLLAVGPPREVLTSERLGPLFGARLELEWSEEGARVRVVDGPGRSP